MSNGPKTNWKYTLHLGKNVLALLICMMATAVMFSGHDGWGWLIFLAAIIAVLA